MAILVLAGLLVSPAREAAVHCDSLDGPVIVAARAALDQGELGPVLKWVRAAEEPEIRDAFRKTLAVRGATPEAKDLADRYFFETLVRVHRARRGARSAAGQSRTLSGGKDAKSGRPPAEVSRFVSRRRQGSRPAVLARSNEI